MVYINPYIPLFYIVPVFSGSTDPCSFGLTVNGTIETIIGSSLSTLPCILNLIILPSQVNPWSRQINVQLKSVQLIYIQYPAVFTRVSTILPFPSVPLGLTLLLQSFKILLYFIFAIKDDIVFRNAYVGVDDDILWFGQKSIDPVTYTLKEAGRI